jgi:xanthine dehydrogenase YagS FAD-binding subunit
LTVQQFRYEAPQSVQSAVETIARQPGSAVIAGGTGVVDLMKLEVAAPQHLVDVNRLPLADILETETHGLRVGALARNSDVAYHPLVRERYPLLSEALLSGASAQLRNMATVGGNLMQRTRCTYFRDVHEACNKRSPGSGCAAMDGFNRTHAIFGTSDHCIATHPSDMCVALICLDASVEVQGPSAKRSIPIEQFHTLPKDTPHIETLLAPDELITAVVLPPSSPGVRSVYRKVRDRASYEFALVSVAALIEISSQTIQSARIAFGGVATKPWRSVGTELALKGALAEEQTFQAAAEAAVMGAAPRRHNSFKVELLKRTLVQTLRELCATEERHS